MVMQLFFINFIAWTNITLHGNRQQLLNNSPLIPTLTSLWNVHIFMHTSSYSKHFHCNTTEYVCGSVNCLCCPGNCCFVLEFSPLFQMSVFQFKTTLIDRISTMSVNQYCERFCVSEGVLRWTFLGSLCEILFWFICLSSEKRIISASVSVLIWTNRTSKVVNCTEYLKTRLQNFVKVSYSVGQLIEQSKQFFGLIGT